MIYGYARVSTAGQQRDGNSLEGQEHELVNNGAGRIFKDAFTGTKIERPAFSELLEIIKPGDTIVVTKLDRISRSAADGIKLVDDLLNKGIKVHILNMGLLDNTPTGKLIRQVMFAFAEFERNMIVQRTSEGKAIAKQREGYKEGRRRIEVDLGDWPELVKRGERTVMQACDALGISKQTWYNRMKETAAA